MTDILIWNALEVEEFIEKIAAGVGPLTSALAVGWTPRKLIERMRDDSFRELVTAAEERKIESVEEKCFEMAVRGNSTMIQFFLLSKGAHRGWRPPTQRVAVNTQSEVRIEVVEAQKEALIQLIREQGIRELQPKQSAIEAGEIGDSSDAG